MSSQWVCSVSHHVTSPWWYDEVKLRLPTPVNNKHHLLFTFVHVSCELSKQKKNENKERDGSYAPESVVGYSWLPLNHKGRLRVDQQCLPVSSHLPPGYLSFEPLGLGKGVSEPIHFLSSVVLRVVVVVVVVVVELPLVVLRVVVVVVVVVVEYLQ